MSDYIEKVLDFMESSKSNKILGWVWLGLSVLNAFIGEYFVSFLMLFLAIHNYELFVIKESHEYLS